MERRRELRAETNEPVVITELGPQPHGPMGGMIQNLAGEGILMRLPHAIACNTLVKVETKNMLLLGEVSRCEPEGEQFRVALMIRHSLQNLHDLENLNRALLSYGTPVQPGVEQAPGGEQAMEEPVTVAVREAAPIMRE